MCANPRSFSQLTTSFVASESLGIRHTPLTISFLIINLFFTLHSRSARLSLCDVFTVNVNDLLFFSSDQQTNIVIGSIRILVSLF